MDVPKLIDSIYGRFVLRDFLGKMVPGFILISIGAYIIVPYNQLIFLVEKLPIWGWFAIGGLSWITAFAIQSFGEAIRFIKYLPPDVNRSDWYNMYMKFKSKSNDASIREHERMVVIMEACGNASISCFLSIALLLISIFIDARGETAFLNTFKNDIFSLGIPFLLLIFGGFFLGRMHREHRLRHYQICEVGISLLDPEQSLEEFGQNGQV